MSIAWMIGSASAGVLLALAALAAERIAGWFGLPRRWTWAAATAASLLLPLVVLAAPGVLPRFHLPSSPPLYVSQPRTVAAGDAAPPATQEATPGAAPRPLPRGVLAGWLAASLAILAGFEVARRRLWRECGALEPRHVAHTPVFVAERAGPMVVGLIEPRIVLPRWAADGPADELRLIVRHECEHVRAGDHWLLAASALAVAAMPWSPALWWQHRRLRLAVETDCDARVLAAGESTERYGRVLLRTAGRGTFLAARAVAWGGRRSHLERRILAMTEHPPRHRLAWALPLSGITLALAAAACGAAAHGTPDVTAPDVAPGVQEHDGRLSGSFPLSDGTELMILGPEPAEGTVGIAWRYGGPPRTRTSPPPTVLPTVTWIAPGSPGESAGVRVGDVIVSVNGRDAREPYMFGDKVPGTAYTLRIRRGGAERDVRLVVGPPPSRAEVQRHMELTAACERREFARATLQERNGRMSPCFFPY